ncbi:hypothetical protein FEE96_22855 [Parasedimentitalea maritima]|uniref:Uncharacterized protein n=1 Tax=Parasedimentitalea maritima TaxID=2578117 RepID=A0ABY2UND3_9RHOB|nr:hypothetical protein [Zongyanglinia marina]TLP55316.1 hypothetical protein FEE96_22855 [Zongyanglinia marina]
MNQVVRNGETSPTEVATKRSTSQSQGEAATRLMDEIDKAKRHLEIRRPKTGPFEDSKIYLTKDIYNFPYTGVMDGYDRLLEAGAKFTKPSHDIQKIVGQKEWIQNGLYMTTLFGSDRGVTGDKLKSLVDRGAISDPSKGPITFDLNNFTNDEVELLVQTSVAMGKGGGPGGHRTASGQFNDRMRQNGFGDFDSKIVHFDWNFRENIGALDISHGKLGKAIDNHVPRGKTLHSDGVISGLLEQGHIEVHQGRILPSKVILQAIADGKIDDREDELAAVSRKAENMFDAIGFSDSSTVSDQNLEVSMDRFTDNYVELMKSIGTYTDLVERDGVPLTENEKDQLVRAMASAKKTSEKAGLHLMEHAQQNSINVSEDSPQRPETGSTFALFASLLAGAAFSFAGGAGLGLTALGGVAAAGSRGKYAMAVARDSVNLLGSVSSLSGSSANYVYAKNHSGVKTLEDAMRRELGDDFLVSVGEAMIGAKKATDFFNKNGMSDASTDFGKTNRGVQKSLEYSVREGNSANALWHLTQKPKINKFENKEYQNIVHDYSKNYFLGAHYYSNQEHFEALKASGWDVDVKVETGRRDSIVYPAWLGDNDDDPSEFIAPLDANLKQKMLNDPSSVKYEDLNEDQRYLVATALYQVVIKQKPGQHLTKVKDGTHLRTGTRQGRDGIQDLRDDVRNNFSHGVLSREKLEKLIEDAWVQAQPPDLIP